MKIRKTLFLALVTGTFLISCNQSKEEKKEEVKNQVTKTSDEVQKVIDELGLVYVEEGAQTIITYEEVNKAQQDWCDALVKIGKLKEEGGDYKSFAEQVLSDAYNYDYGKVFFKPTLAYGDQTFRNDKKGALAYFIGGDADYPNDKGFALTPWVKARYDNAGKNNEGIQIYGSIAITMGNVWVTDKNGKEVMVDKTWVFKKGKDGKLRIIVHKSSLPFSPTK
ncbi:MAG: hypothetical protein O9282_08375 [Flavobacterium sp.]|jgi:hypothetical protein|uniref:Phosphoribosyl-AMP cyclohydrolase n=1 Tax=Flavobacterium macrobrachii TaxID=591204 RepID=A0ABS2CUX5_9FLAO|nr:MULTISPECIES: hypothetical protein [Flavobacterium]MBM6498771.1 hypothetical protein [Flavobacterium macrobrachii]MCZ8089598.1 hypothetical protein [Flavobacterium sp.]MCZ8331313.1 hypothetical protein [Flavobacterium sp.]